MIKLSVYELFNEGSLVPSCFFPFSEVWSWSQFVSLQTQQDIADRHSLSLKLTIGSELTGSCSLSFILMVPFIDQYCSLMNTEATIIYSTSLCLGLIYGQDARHLEHISISTHQLWSTRRYVRYMAKGQQQTLLKSGYLSLPTDGALLDMENLR